MGKKLERQEKPCDRTLSIIGIVEPWEPRMDSKVRIEAKDYRAETVIEAVHPTEFGKFTLKLELTIELKELLQSGNVEIRATDRKGKVLGKIRIAPYAGTAPIAMKLHIIRPDLGLHPSVVISNAIITQATVHHLARKLARIQGVDIQNARAPHSIVKVIQELNEISQLASRCLTGDKVAEKSILQVLSTSAFTNPGGAPRRFGGMGAMSDTRLLDMLGELQVGRLCGPVLLRTTKVLDSAFRLDFKERNRDAKWTRQARSYIRNRIQDFSAYDASVDQAYRGSRSQGAGFPSGDDGLTTHLLPIIDVFPPEPEPVSGTVHEPTLCEMTYDLCLALYEELLAALANDTYTDLIASVEPNCLCSNYDPNQVFVARPRARDTFPIIQTAAGPQLPTWISLYFRGQVITPISVNPNEIHFRIPPNESTGHVYLQAVGIRPSQASRRLANSCGLVMPNFAMPEFAPLLLDRSPAALISIISPPVVDFLKSDAGPQPAEACTPVEISWRVNLFDQSPTIPIPPCGSIEVTIRDGQGNQITMGGPAGSVLETRSDTTIYTIEAVSRANQLQCGTAAPVSLTVERVKYVRLEGDPSTGTEHRGGTNGRFVVRISCPAPQNGLPVLLTSSNPAVLRVPSPVTIPAGGTSLPVEFTTTQACMSVEVTAAAADHTPSVSLHYEVYSMPSLQWATGAPPNIQEGDIFSAEVDTSCVPDDSARVNWLLINVNPGGSQPLPLSARSVTGQYPAVRFRVDLGRTLAADLIPGNWELVVEIADRHVRSQGLRFPVVPRPQFNLSIIGSSEQTVEWDQPADYQATVEGQNITTNVTISLMAIDLPDGIETRFNPPRVDLNPGNTIQNSTLTLRSRKFIGPIGTINFTIQASANNFPTRSFPATLNVKHTQGGFTRMQVIWNSMTCNGNGIRAAVGGNGMTRIVTFSIPTSTGEVSISPNAVYYTISPQCKVGVVIPPWSDPAVDPAVNLFNLGFARTTGAPELGELIIQGGLTRIFWQQFWFSPDDTLLVIIGRTTRMSGTTETHTYGLYNTITGDQIDDGFFSPAIVQAIDDPSPLQDGEKEYQLAVITSIVLGKDNGNRDAVIITYPDNIDVLSERSFSIPLE